MEIIIIILLILLNGVFSMSEMALVSSRSFKLKTEKKKGNYSARKAMELAENPNQFLSTVQIGITLIGILLGIYSGNRITTDVAEFISKYEIFSHYSREIASFLVVVIITFLSIVFGELIPKRLGLKFPEKISMFIARPMYWLSILASPFVWLLTITNEGFLKFFGIQNDAKDTITEEEIKSMIREGKEGGIIEEREHDVLKNVFELGDRKVSSMATHKSKIITVDADDSYQTVKEKIKNSSFSVYPVTSSNNIDNIIGVVKMRDLFDLDHNQFNLREHLRKAIFVSENSLIYPLMENFQNNKSHVAIVIDEYGTTKGIITLNDILDDLVGNIPDGSDNEPEIIKRTENSWLVDGKCSIYDFKKYFNIEIDEAIEKNFISISGLFISTTDKVPKTGDRIKIGNLLLEIVDKDGTRIDKVMVKKSDEL
ncbi:hemolysin family protein [Chryseobacterium populi]|uniref:CBS domain-containing protein n=1 Tax=Chryseobacterium populi TaxID=1144316 RepID=J2KQT9_9FLAO|nr:hemolysin family protein [Chryseobacterium populi]EJL75433.1 CBS domain-containing protein [Chryseobacterium populi]